MFSRCSCAAIQGYCLSHGSESFQLLPCLAIIQQLKFKLRDTNAIRRIANISQQQTTLPTLRTALRPFIFSVHPDLFHLYPEQKMQNESSLKALNQYVQHAVENEPQLATSPFSGQHLRFYQRVQDEDVSSQQKDNFRLLKITLNEDVLATVKKLLEQGNFSVVHIDSLIQNQEMYKDRSGDRRIDWINASYYAATGRENPFINIWDEVTRLKPVITLHQWVSKNIKDAKMLEQESRPIRNDCHVMSERVCQEHNILELKWECGWRGSHQLAALRRLHSLLASNIIARKTAAGRRIVFSNESGVSFNGDILLSSDEVQEQWLQMLLRVPSLDKTMKLINGAEEHLSSLLGAAQIVRKLKPPQPMASPYYYSLATLIGKLGMAPASPDLGSLTNLHVQVTSSGADGVTLTSEGYICVPSETPVWALRNFIRENRSLAEKVNTQWTRDKAEGEKLFVKVQSDFNLQNITVDTSVSWDKVVHCCDNLLKNGDSVRHMLSDTRLCIAPYFSVMADGEVCITWDWTNHD